MTNTDFYNGIAFASAVYLIDAMFIGAVDVIGFSAGVVTAIALSISSKWSDSDD